MFRQVISCAAGLLMAGTAQAQTQTRTIAAKLTGSPLFLLTDALPATAGLGTEVGISRRSSVQVLGSYRHFVHEDEEPDTGPKVTLEYRYYPKPEVPNSGLFLSPYAGLGLLRLGLGDEPPAGATRRRRTEREAGLLVGHQAVFSRFTAEAFAGPAYYWTTTTGGSFPKHTSRFPWVRAGFTVGLRLNR